MKKVVRFFLRYRTSIVFVLLAASSLWIALDERLQGSLQIHSAHSISGQVYAFFYNFKSHLQIKKKYDQIVEENLALVKAQVALQAAEQKNRMPPEFLEALHVIPAQVINNTIVYTKNYITLNKGAQAGIVPGMGVVSAQGVVGRVKSVSPHFSSVVSLLHTDVLVSAQLTGSGAMGTVRWGGKNLFSACLLYIPRHIHVEVGEKVVTSGFNAIFSPGLSIGVVKQVHLEDEALFYDIEIDLKTDFSTLQEVYVLENKFKQEKEALEQVTKAYYE